jgi:ribonuclease-3
LKGSNLEANVEKVENLIDYKFEDKTLIIEALTHKSLNQSYSNEKLEFVGDAILNFTIASYLYRKFPKHNEGELSKLRSSLVSKDGLIKIAEKLDLGQYIFISDAEEKNNGRIKRSILSDTVEAIIAAIYLDSDDMKKTQKFITDHYEDIYPEISMEAVFNDYKTILQEITQAKYGVIPDYRVLSTEGPDHEITFEIGVFINDQLYGKAHGKSKKSAEQKSAQITIDAIPD